MNPFTNLSKGVDVFRVVQGFVSHQSEKQVAFMLDIFPSLKMVVGGFRQKGIVGQVFRIERFFEVYILLMDNTTNGQLL